MTKENNAGVEVDPTDITINPSKYTHTELGWCSRCEDLYCSHEKKHFAHIYQLDKI